MRPLSAPVPRTEERTLESELNRWLPQALEGLQEKEKKKMQRWLPQRLSVSEHASLTEEEKRKEAMRMTMLTQALEGSETMLLEGSSPQEIALLLQRTLLTLTEQIDESPLSGL